MTIYLLMLGIYVYLAFVVAVLGRSSRLGFFRCFGLSLVMTPIVALAVLLLGYELRPATRADKRRLTQQGASKS